MNCRYVETRVAAFADGELDGAEMQVVRRHLNSCPACAALLAGSKRTKQLLSALPESRPDAGFEDRLVAAIRSESRGSRMPSGSWLPIKFGWAAGAVAAVAAVSAVLLSRPPDAPESPSIAASTNDLPDGMVRDQFYYQASNPLSNGIPVSHEGRRRSR